MAIFEGAGVALVTPFKENGEVNYEKLEEIVEEQNLTTLMITHNMKDAISIGNRLVMMHEGRIIYDVSGDEKKKLEVDDLLKKFEEASGEEFANDRMILAK